MIQRLAFPLILLALCAAALAAAGRTGDHWAIGVLAGLLAALVIFGVYYLLFGLRLAAVLVRVAMALVPVGALTLGLIYAVLNWPGLNDVLLAPLIAAVIVAAGWVVGFLTGEWRRVSSEQERRRDLIRAAISELELIANHGRKANWDKAIADEKQNFARDPNYAVFIFYGHQFVTLKRLVEQIEVLSWDQIRPVMDIYQALDRLERMEAKMALDAFRDLPQPRRQDGLVRYLRLNAQVPEFAEDAVAALRDGPFRGWLEKLS